MLMPGRLSRGVAIPRRFIRHDRDLLICPSIRDAYLPRFIAKSAIARRSPLSVTARCRNDVSCLPLFLVDDVKRDAWHGYRLRSPRFVAHDVADQLCFKNNDSGARHLHRSRCYAMARGAGPMRPSARHRGDTGMPMTLFTPPPLCAR